MKSESTKSWIDRAVWVLAFGFMLWMGINSFSSSTSEAPSEAEAAQHSSWILRFNKL